MDAFKIAVKNADQIDHCVVAAYQFFQLRLVEYIRFDNIDCGQREQMFATFSSPRRNGNEDFLPRQLFGNRCPDKACTTDEQYFVYFHFVIRFFVQFASV